MSCLGDTKVGDKIATVRYGASGGARPVLKIWTVIKVTKTTVRATCGGVARSWSIPTGSPMSYYSEPEAMPYTPAVQQQHDARLDAWEAHEDRMRERSRVAQARSDALDDLAWIVREAATIERIDAIVAAAKKAAEGGAA